VRHAHELRVYACGHMEGQCRCIGPKNTVVLGEPCEECAGKDVTLFRAGLYPPGQDPKPRRDHAAGT
jgi:hypothetical protein